MYPRVQLQATAFAVVGVLGVLSLGACVPGDGASPDEEPEGRSTASVPEAPRGDAPERIAVIGDSLSTGFGTSPEDAWPSQLARVLQPWPQPVEITNASKNGSGYLTPGDGGETFARR